jgi:hypothetical protein
MSGGQEHARLDIDVPWRGCWFGVRELLRT